MHTQNLSPRPLAGLALAHGKKGKERRERGREGERKRGRERERRGKRKEGKRRREGRRKERSVNKLVSD